MKRDEIQKCALCGRGVMHSGNITFYGIRLERFIVDLGAVQRRASQEMFFGGGTTGALLAGVMGADEDLAKPIGDPVQCLVCEQCSMERTCLAQIHEKVSEQSSVEVKP